MDTIDKILADLYSYDPGFKAHETELKKIISKLLAEKPNTQFDPLFAESLRKKLLIQAEIMEPTTQKNFFFSRKLSLAFSGVLLLAVVFLGTKYIQQQNSNKQTKLASNEIFSGKINIQNLKANAFGKLNIQNDGQGQNMDTSARPQSGGGGGGASNATAMMVTAPTSESASLKMAPGYGGDSLIYPYKQVVYKYKGEDFTIENPEVTVYKKSNNPISAGIFAQALSSMNFGVFDLNSFSNVKLQNLSFSEDKDFGYSFYINMEDGSMGISENWMKWQTPDRLCRDVACSEKYRLKASDIPADSEVISIAEGFLAEHGINRGNYGEARVDDYWRQDLARATDPSQIWIPDVVNVVFPLVVEGKTVYDESGQTTGLSVSVNVRVKKVSSVYDLSELNFDASGYTAETDVKKLITLAETGSFRNYPMPYAAEGMTQPEKVEIGLGSPKIELVRFYSYTAMTNEQVLVPSLVFPVLDTSTEPYMYYPKNIVIPLVTDVIQNGDYQIMR